MSDHLEFLRKEAKSLLKLYRTHDAAALARVRAVLPRIADDIKLADVQFVLARENGQTNWGKLKQQFSKPGDDGGVLPDGYTPWRWSVTYTLWPELLAPLKYGKEYRILVSVLRNIPDDDNFPGYADLYDRVVAIANGRAAQLPPPGSGMVMHTRIVNHGWFRHQNSNLVRSFMTFGVVCLNPSDPKPQGVTLPHREKLAVPGGMTPENYALPGDDVDKRSHEMYSDGDARDPLNPDTNVFMFSYGEYVQDSRAVDYKPLLEKAEKLAQFHLPGNELRIIRREWLCATNPDIAVIHLYIQT